MTVLCNPERQLKKSEAKKNRSLQQQKKRRVKIKNLLEIKNALKSAMPHNITPMLSSIEKRAFNSAEWIFEIKWDGYRAIAEIQKNKVLLYSRNNKNFNDKFSVIVESLKKLKFDAVLDGEVVFMDKNGKPDFQKIHDYRSSRTKKTNGQLIFYVFDILYYNGRDLRDVELLKRKELLEKIFPSLRM